MEILIAEDDRVSRRMLQAILTEWGYETQLACDGASAWEIIQHHEGPQLAILDWLMPGLDGLEICRKVRALASQQPIYLILLTVKGSRQDVIAGLEGGADDYITKPFDLEELHARLHTGLRIVELQQSLAGRVRQLEDALANVKQLQGLLPICCYCKKIRDDCNYWQQVEAYIASHSDARFSHGICPTCWEVRVRPELKKLGQDQAPAFSSQALP